MDSMLGQIKDIVESKDPILYDHIHTRGQKVGSSQRSTACLSICINTKILFSILVGQTSTLGGVRRKPHTDPEVQVGYRAAIDKLVPDEEECALLHSELSKYLSEIGPFGTLHARKDRVGRLLLSGGTCMAHHPHACINWQPKCFHRW